MKPAVLVTRRIPDEAVALLRGGCDVDVNAEDRALSRDELLSRVKGKAGILPLFTDKIDKAVMDSAGASLKAIGNCAVGFDNIDVAEATKRGIAVTNTPDVLTETTADFTWALILGIARRLVEADAFTRAGKFKGWDLHLMLGSDVHGKTLGIIGFGRIGKAVYERSKGFGMKALVYHPRAKSDPRYPDVSFVPLDELLARSDFITIHAPLNDETRSLIGDAQLKKMKRTAYLVNVARGPVVDEAALANALRSGSIAGAALDVYEREPEIHPDLLNLSNVVLAPHLGSATRETRVRMALLAAENLLAALRGERPPNPVNSELFTSA